MIVRLVMLGTGEDDDPYRADLPSYSTLAYDAINMQITVSMSPRVGPPQVPAKPGQYWIAENGVDILVGMPADMLTGWWQMLAARYPGHTPPYMPGFN
jgi:hypothetical protein